MKHVTLLHVQICLVDITGRPKRRVIVPVSNLQAVESGKITLDCNRETIKPDHSSQVEEKSKGQKQLQLITLVWDENAWVKD